MVTVANVHQRLSKEGRAFVVLELHGDIELVQSSVNGKFYATSKKCFITSTFSEDVAKTFIGNTLNGSIDRVECEPYHFKIPNTGEVIMLAHTYTYKPVEESQKIRENKSQNVTMTA